MKTLRLLLAFALALAPVTQALAGAGTITTKDAAGATRTFVVTTDGSGNFVSQTVLCDATAAATCAAVDASGLAVKATQTGTWNITNVSGTISLPTGAATSANQATEIASLSTIATNTGAAIPAGSAIIGKVGIDQTAPGTTNLVALTAETTKNVGTVRTSDGSGNLYVADPCSTVAQTSTPISITTNTTTRIVSPTAAKKTYICYIFLTSAAADNVGIVEGTGGTCGTGTAGVIGGATAANGPNFAANGGAAFSAGGLVAAAVTAGTNVDLCLITSAATPLAGVIKWVQAP